MRVKIITFGRIAELAGNNLEVNDIYDTDELKSFLEEKYPEIRNTKYIMAVDKEVVSENTKLEPDVIVALLPPFSGG